ncbi:MAG: isohexenylglutaconyl-CoA hydratase [Phototrophicales bacterium]
MTYETLAIEIKQPFAYVTLNRPEVRNAMNQQMVQDLLHFFDSIRENRAIRAVVLAGAGGHFCAGGDIKEMQESFANPQDDGSTRTAEFDRMLQAVERAPQVVVARVEGAAMGGGFGLVCVSDIAIASTDAKFGLPEVRLGIVPALISPYVIRRMGLTEARKLMLTGGRFSGMEAARYGVVHDVTEPQALDATVQAILEDIRQCSPEALAACKELIFRAVDGDTTAEYRAKKLDALRRSESGQEGMMAFIQKRKPTWAEGGQA